MGIKHDFSNDKLIKAREMLNMKSERPVKLNKRIKYRSK